MHSAWKKRGGEERAKIEAGSQLANCVEREERKEAGMQADGWRSAKKLANLSPFLRNTIRWEPKMYKRIIRHYYYYYGCCKRGIHRCPDLHFAPQSKGARARPVLISHFRWWGRFSRCIFARRICTSAILRARASLDMEEVRAGGILSTH